MIQKTNYEQLDDLSKEYSFNVGFDVELALSDLDKQIMEAFSSFELPIQLKPVMEMSSMVFDMWANLDSLFSNKSYKKFAEMGNSIGDSIVAGINYGMKKNLDELSAMIFYIANDMEDCLKDALKINSPSKVFAKIGESVTEGLVDGIKEGSDDVTDTMRGLGDDMESSFGEKALSFGGGFALAAGVLGTIVEMFSNLMSTNEEFGAAVDEVWTQITEAFAPVTEAVMNLITSLGEEGMGGNFSWFSDALNGVSELAVSVIGTIGEFWAEHGEAIMLSVGEIWEFVYYVVDEVVKFISYFYFEQWRILLRI